MESLVGYIREFRIGDPSGVIIGIKVVGSGTGGLVNRRIYIGLAVGPSILRLDPEHIRLLVIIILYDGFFEHASEVDGESSRLVTLFTVYIEGQLLLQREWVTDCKMSFLRVISDRIGCDGQFLNVFVDIITLCLFGLEILPHIHSTVF